MSSISDSASVSENEAVRLGVYGLGRGFALSARGFHAHPSINVVATASSNAQAKAAVAADFSATNYSTLDELCAEEKVEIVYVATPHQLHCEHVLTCAAAGKHVVVEKPMSVTLGDARKMIDACQKANVHLLVGPSHSFDGPVLLAREFIDSRRLGRVRMIHALNCTEFLYRPRRPEELDTESGGGVIFSQAIHQVDVVRRLMPSMATHVVGMTGNWDDTRSTEGAYSAMVRFEDSSFASMTYSGYAHFDSDIWMDNIGELGVEKNRANYGSARASLNNSEDEIVDKMQRRYEGLDTLPQPITNEHFGPVIVFCENGDIRLTPNSLELYENEKRRVVPCNYNFVRESFCNALVDTVRRNQPPPQNGQWGLASLEICHAILHSDKSGAMIALQHQQTKAQATQL